MELAIPEDIQMDAASHLVGFSQSHTYPLSALPRSNCVGITARKVLEMQFSGFTADPGSQKLSWAGVIL